VSTPEDAGTIVALAQSGGTRSLVAGRAVLREAGAGDPAETGPEWETYPLPDGAANPVDLLNMADGSVLLLDAAGTIWRLEA
jgi:streptogramin lyase